MNESQRYLVTLLAQSDATLVPNRSFDPMERAVAIGERQRRFREAGVPYAAPTGATNAERIRQVYEVDALEAEGWITCQRKRNRRASWRFTSVADWAMRWMCLLFGQEEITATLSAIREAAEAGRVHGNGRFVPEVELANGRGWGDGQGGLLVDLEERLLPALTRGLVESASDSQGRVAYRLTAAGAAWLDAEQPKPELPEHPAALLDEASDLNTSTFLDAVKARDDWKPEATNAVEIPLSAGLWPDIPKPNQGPTRSNGTGQ